MTNRNKGLDYHESMSTQSQNNQTALSAEKRVCDQVALVFSSASDWLREWRKILGPIVKQS